MATQQAMHLFEGVDLDRHQRMLASALRMVVLAAGEGVDPAFLLEDLARLHGPQGMDVPRERYDYWVEAMLTTAALTDPKFHADLRKAWIEVMRPAIRYMRSIA